MLFGPTGKHTGGSFGSWGQKCQEWGGVGETGLQKRGIFGGDNEAKVPKGQGKRQTTLKKDKKTTQQRVGESGSKKKKNTKDSQIGQKRGEIQKREKTVVTPPLVKTELKPFHGAQERNK